MLRTILVAVIASLIGAPLQAQAVKVIDQRGNAVELTAPAERIVVIPLPLPSVIMALDGSAKRLLAIQPLARKSIEDGFLKRVFPEALDLPTGIVRGGPFNPNVESILGLKPDLVVQWHQPPELISSLESAGLKAIGLANDPPTQEILERNLTIMGEAIGRGERVRAILEMHHATLAKISAVSDTIAEEARPRVLYFREFGPTLLTSRAGTYRDFWTRLAGGRAVAGGKGTNLTVNKEQVIAWNPQIILLGAFDDSTPDMVLSTPEFSVIDAVRNRRVYKLPHGGYRWDPGSHESFLTWQWAAMLMQPDRFDLDLRSEMRRAYEFFYDYRLADAEIDEILRMDLNGAMSGYERFKR